MAYEPKTWQCGEVVSAEALNHIEQGIAEASSGGGGAEPLIVKMTRTADFYNDTDVLFVADATTSEIKNALFAGKPVIANIISKHPMARYLLLGLQRYHTLQVSF